MIPNVLRLQAGCRKAGIEVMYTVIGNLTKDGRDRRFDYKIAGFSMPPESYDGKVHRCDQAGETTRWSSRRPHPTSSSRPTSTTCSAISARKYLVISGIRNRPMRRRLPCATPATSATW